MAFPQLLRISGTSSPSQAQEDTGAISADTASAIPEENDPDCRDLRPLLQYLSIGYGGVSNAGQLRELLSRTFPTITPPERHSAAPERPIKDPSVHCLMVTLPDPVASVASARFDELLDIVQHAVELQGFVLDRSRLPWRPSSSAASSPAGQIARGRLGGIGLEVRLDSTASPQAKEGRPGLIVFRQAFPQHKKDPTILLVFIVPESPVHGIDKAAFTRSLDLINRYFYGQLTWEWDQKNEPIKPALRKRIVHIVAPCFAASERSLEVALHNWKGADEGDKERPYHLRVISNNAGLVARDRIEEESALRRVSFRSMVHKTTIVADRLLKYIRTELGYDSRHVALLIESSSGMAQAFAEHSLRNEDSDEFIYPLQVAEVRKAYEKQGLLEGGNLDAAGAPERLTIPPDEAGEPKDLPHSFTPSSSAAFDELALTQVLTTISHRRYQAVGILASNPFDVVFLARRVRQFSPNVRLFAIQADLLYTRPQNVTDLRGMLVASTYSLYPTNQWIITPYGQTPRVLFNHQSGEGLYNAVVAHLWEMDVIRDVQGQSPDVPPLLDFGMPYRATVRAGDAGAVPDASRPPVWISSVGERGLFPVASLDVSEDYDYLYDIHLAPDAPRVRRTPPRADGGEDQRLAAMRPNAHLLYWFFCLVLIFACFTVAGLTWTYVRWSADPSKTELDTRVLGFSLGHLLKALNCEVAPSDGPSAPYDPQARFRDPIGNESSHMPPLGAGIYLVLINLVVLALSHYIFSNLLVAMRPHLAPVGVWLYFACIVAGASTALVTASSLMAILEALRVAGSVSELSRWYQWKPKVSGPMLWKARFPLFLLGVALAACWLFSLYRGDPTERRLTFETDLVPPQRRLARFPHALPGRRHRRVDSGPAHAPTALPPVLSADDPSHGRAEGGEPVGEATLRDARGPAGRQPADHRTGACVPARPPRLALGFVAALCAPAHSPRDSRNPTLLRGAVF